MNFKEFLELGNNRNKDYSEIENNKDKCLPILKKRNLYKKQYTLMIDSRDRNRTNYINSNNFVVKINSGNLSNPTINFNYKNIHQIFLTTVVLPRRVVSIQYIILEINELKHEINGTNKNLSNAFAIIIPEHHSNDGDFVNCTINYVDFHKHTFIPPMASLPNTLTFTLKQPNGQLLDLGTDNLLPLEPKDSVQAFFIFKIICNEEDLRLLEHRMID